MNMQERIGASDALVNLFNSAKEKFTKDFSTATLAQIVEVTKTFSDGYGIAAVLPIPQWDSDGTNRLEGYFFSDKTFTAGELVLLIFTDNDFRQIINAGHWSPRKVDNSNTHSKNFGVILKL